MTTTDDRIEVKFLGKLLGTASGWDGDPGEHWWVYDFKPNEGCKLCACAQLYFNEIKGVVTAENERNAIILTCDIKWELVEIYRMKTS